MPILRYLLLYLVSAPLAAAPYFVHCYDFGCRSTQEIHFSEQHWREIKSIFNRVELDPGQERRAIRQAAVDSWYRDNGEMPYIQPLDDWLRKCEFPVAFNPELASN